MSFNIDAQSLKDLHIFIGSSDQDSISSMFKATKTLGGRERLHELMAAPTSDIKVLNSRKEAIKYFYTQAISLDISVEQLDLIEHYLKFDKKHSRNNMLDSLAYFIQNRKGNDYYIIKTGLMHLIKLLQYSTRFLSQLSSNDLPSNPLPDGLKDIIQQLNRIIKNGIFKEAQLITGKKLRFYQLSRLDHALRGKEKKALKEFLNLIYELDVFCIVAETAHKKGLCFPDYLDHEEVNLEITGLFHPAISNPVKNDVIFQKDKNMIFLTGSNMAGKSSLLKSLGLSIYLSHLGFPVPASQMRTTVFNGLITTINLSDNINQGLSHYYSEVKRVKDTASALLQHDKMFIIFDELFRGTNVKDAYDASLSIISELSFIKNSIFLISTHIIEIADELRKFENISFNYLDTFFKDDKPVFTYQLKEGVSKERMGLYIMQNEGIIEIIRQVAARQKA